MEDETMTNALTALEQIAIMRSRLSELRGRILAKMLREESENAR